MLSFSNDSLEWNGDLCAHAIINSFLRLGFLLWSLTSSLGEESKKGVVLSSNSLSLPANKRMRERWTKVLCSMDMEYKPRFAMFKVSCCSHLFNENARKCYHNTYVFRTCATILIRWLRDSFKRKRTFVVFFSFTFSFFSSPAASKLSLCKIIYLPIVVIHFLRAILDGTHRIARTETYSNYKRLKEYATESEQIFKNEKNDKEKDRERERGLST